MVDRVTDFYQFLAETLRKGLRGAIVNLPFIGGRRGEIDKTRHDAPGHTGQYHKQFKAVMNVKPSVATGTSLINVP